MEDLNYTSLLLLAFGLGLMHALDADHVMAVTGLASAQSRIRHIVRFCVRWALGHGASLLSIGIAVLLLGMAIPTALSHYAEFAVGVMLIIIGGFVIVDLMRSKAHLHFHRHDDLPQHAHWHTHQPNNDHQSNNHHKDKHRHQHAAVLVGMVHGIAGSAPLLVLLPVAQLGTPLLGIGYIVLFSTGVLSAMLVFGGVLGSVYNILNSYGTRLVKSVRLMIGGSAVVVGSVMLIGAGG